MPTSARFWIDSLLSAASASLFGLTVFWRTWIEQLFGVDPDRGSGTLEWSIVVSLFAVAIAFGALARSEWRRLHAVA